MMFAILFTVAIVFGLLSNLGTPVGNMAGQRTEAILSEIQGGLELYKIDHGEYPPNPALDRDETAKYGAHVLYKYLSGDFDGDGEFDTDDPSNKIYVESLDFRSSEGQGKGTVGIDTEGRYIATDGYGNPIRYLCDPPKRMSYETRTMNPTYDLWSLGGAEPGKKDPENRARWITNWGAN